LRATAASIFAIAADLSPPADGGPVCAAVPASAVDCASARSPRSSAPPCLPEPRVPPVPLSPVPLSPVPLSGVPADSAALLESALFEPAPLDSAPLESAPLESAPLSSASAIALNIGCSEWWCAACCFWVSLPLDWPPPDFFDRRPRRDSFLPEPLSGSATIGSSCSTRPRPWQCSQGVENASTSPVPSRLRVICTSPSDVTSDTWCRV